MLLIRRCCTKYCTFFVAALLQLVTISLISLPCPRVLAQDVGFELPVQLIGFPVIIMAVRMSNFVKKLAYSLNPNTYRRSVRTVRGVRTSGEPPLNLAKADRELARQFGPNFCVYEDACLQHVRMAATKSAPDWREIFDNFGQLPPSKQQYYLLSVFLGDIIRSEKLCQHFRETGRICH